tara:strand:- start:31 stop:861 length:831 start_codon:yes stop_codon:yes gene_type:complete
LFFVKLSSIPHSIHDSASTNSILFVSLPLQTKDKLKHYLFVPMKNFFSLLVLVVLFTNLAGQNYIQQINDSLQTIPLIIEGVVENVEIYAADNDGHRIPESELIWDNEVGIWKQEDGSDAIGYSKATIRFCQVYRGDIVPDTRYIEVLTYSEILDPYAQNINGNLKVGYHFFMPSHGFSKQIFLPESVGSKQIFFIIDNDKPTGTYTLSDIGSIVYHLDYDDNNDHPLANNAFAVGNGLFEYISNTYTEDEINTYLEQFSAIDLHGINHCKEYTAE